MCGCGEKNNKTMKIETKIDDLSLSQKFLFVIEEELVVG